ncbi:TPA: hypothetical protein DCX16_02140, partial [bacterium]|nr:hypothetical protein [bacterium]
MYANVALRIPSNTLYTYRLPEDLEKDACIGKRVLVPLRGKEVVGFLIELKESPEFTGRIKDIITILDEEPLIDESLIFLANWISSYYLCSLGDCLSLLIPPGLSWKIKKFIKRIDFSDIEYLKKKAPAQYKILSLLNEKGKIETAQISKIIKNPHSIIKSLEEKGAIEVIRKIKQPSTPSKKQKEEFQLESHFTPNKDQDEAISKISLALEKNRFEAFLLYGITGSGKTEVYLQVIQKVIDMGGQAIVLVPEISLTSQIVNRFKARFGDKSAILHSRLTNKERLIEWQRIRNNEASIVVGARSAIFAG